MATASVKRPHLPVWNLRLHREAILATVPSAKVASHRIHIDGIERLPCRHEEPVVLLPAEAKIAPRFRQLDLADEFALGIEDLRAVETVATPAGAGPHISIHIAAHSIRAAGPQGDAVVFVTTDDGAV